MKLTVLLAGLAALSQAPAPKAAPPAKGAPAKEASGAKEAPAREGLDAPEAEEPQPDKASVRLVTDGKQHFIAFPKDDKEAWRGPHYWSAEGKAFYRLRSPGGGADGLKSFGVTLWEPRIRGRGMTAGFGYREGKYSVTCGEKEVELVPVPEAEARPLLEGATFYKPRWRRMPYALARDERGVYYFVDHLRDEERSGERRRDFRLFTGPRGALKEQKMTNLVSDSEGDIFGTRSGEFRLVLNREHGNRESKWVTGSKETKLTWVPVEDNVQVIYNDLGVYERAKLGTPCDVF